jgi:hypothetical protein
MHVHKVVLEEFLQLPLGGRVSEISNVESPSLSSAGQDRLVLGGGGLGAGGLSSLVEGGSGHLGGHTVGCSGHDCRSLNELTNTRYRSV